MAEKNSDYVREIVLTGFKGSGKTRVGKLLAKKLGFGFIDIDHIIEDLHVNSGQPRSKVRTIYKKFGKEFFQKMEGAAIGRLPSYKKHVISLGGGTPLHADFNKSAFIGAIFVHLEVAPETLYKRIKAKGIPPFIDKRAPKKGIFELIKKRSPYYEELSHFSVDNTDRKPAEVVKEIIEKLEERDGW